MRNKRPCKKCGKLYQPRGKYVKICNECFKKVREKAQEKGWGNRPKEESEDKKINLIVLSLIILIMLLNINFISALRVDFIDAQSILPGESSRLFIGIENDGDDDIRDVSVELDFTELPFAPFNSNSEYGINEIRDGKTEVAMFEIIGLNAKSGIYKIPLKISYKIEDETTIHTKESVISLVVDSIPIIKASPRIEEGVILLKGKSNEILIDILNKGLSDVQFAEVEIRNSIYFNSLKTIEYIGDINGDDYEYVNFMIYFKENAPRTVSIPIIIRYQDIFNKQYEKELVVKVNTYTLQEAIDEGLIAKDYKPMMIGGVAVLIIVFIIYRKIKKWLKNKNKKDYYEEKGEEK